LQTFNYKMFILFYGVGIQLDCLLNKAEHNVHPFHSQLRILRIEIFAMRGRFDDATSDIRRTPKVLHVPNTHSGCLELRVSACRSYPQVRIRTRDALIKV